MINVLGKMQQFGAIWALIDEMRQENPILISPQMFVILKRKFASARMVQKAIEVLDEKPNYRCEPDEYVFGCLLDALCKNCSIKEAASLFEDMRYQFLPTIKHFTFLLYVKKIERGYELLDRMIQQGLVPNQLTYHHLMLAHKKKEELEEYMELVNEMHKIGCPPDLNIYNTVIRLACRLGEIKEGVRLWNEMEASGISLGINTFVMIINGFLNQACQIEACEHFKEMVDKGIFTTPQYAEHTDGDSHKIRYCSSFTPFLASPLPFLKSLDKKIHYLNCFLLVFEACSPPLNHKSLEFDNSSNCISSAASTRHFGLILLQCSPEKVVNDQRYDEFASDVEKVYRILRKYHYRIPKLELALKESGIIVRPGLTERILNRCGNAGNLAYRFYAWASKQSNYQHSQEVYKVIIKVLGKMQQFRAVWALIDEMRQENPMLISPKMFIILMRKFASARMVQKAIEVLDEIPNYRCEFDEYVFGCLLDALCKNGSIKEVVSLFKDMRYRFPPTIKHFTSLLYSWCREGKLMEAKHVLVQMNNAGIEPDIVVYNNLLSGYALAAKMGDAYDLLKEMRMIGCGPNATLYRILI
ncbi:hypothetical protein Ahy_A07g032772 [Arachis hypogaea]|uniref:Pentacotripeptide-repeat region of PRORP domain-containing protein n=1 Tax=Arachis hypogaea TaxID=3818 RepID=A0A445C7G7_ARAHY|nr:hypothetical protein Ahy_A07g032772 [Arachis hypogaea]